MTASLLRDAGITVDITDQLQEEINTEWTWASHPMPWLDRDETRLMSADAQKIHDDIQSRTPHHQLHAHDGHTTVSSLLWHGTATASAPTQIVSTLLNSMTTGNVWGSAPSTSTTESTIAQATRPLADAGWKHTIDGRYLTWEAPGPEVVGIQLDAFAAQQPYTHVDRLGWPHSPPTELGTTPVRARPGSPAAGHRLRNARGTGHPPRTSDDSWRSRPPRGSSHGAGNSITTGRPATRAHPVPLPCTDQGQGDTSRRISGWRSRGSSALLLVHRRSLPTASKATSRQQPTTPHSAGQRPAGDL
ncbi:hypothetical protein [Streptomyces sp. bgisy034]|uniref:hypothetical protein n=1 Tax=Streptomyces sp. bgisy034 TaxID=3413774 RepID=UPI003EB7C5F1